MTANLLSLRHHPGTPKSTDNLEGWVKSEASYTLSYKSNANKNRSLGFKLDIKCFLYISNSYVIRRQFCLIRWLDLLNKIT